MESMFELASREKWRFPFRGVISVEDLWDLSPVELDSVFKTLNAQVKQTKEESLLTTKSKADAVLEAQIELIKYIMSVKLAEQEARKQAKARSEQRQKILATLAEKQDEELHSKSSEELKQMLDSLE